MPEYRLPALTLDHHDVCRLKAIYQCGGLSGYYHLNTF